MNYNKAFDSIAKVSVFMMLVIPIYTGVYIPTLGVVGPHKLLPILMIVLSVPFIVRKGIKVNISRPIFSMIILQAVLFLYTLIQTFILSDSSVHGQVIQYALIVFLFGSVLPYVYIIKGINGNWLFNTVLLSVTCIVVITLFESFVGMSLAPFLSFHSTEFIEEISLGKFRGDDYRVMSIFTNSLVLSQFIVFSLPLVSYYVNKRGVSKLNKFIIYTIFLYLQILTASRTGIILVLLTPIMYMCYGIVLNVKISQSKIIVVLTLIGLAFIAFFSPLIIEVYALHAYSFGELLTSALARVNQLNLIMAVASSSLNNLIFGVGSGNGIFYMKEHFYSIDNFYLSLLLEQGVLGIVLRLFILISFIKLIYRCTKLNLDAAVAILTSLFMVMSAYSTLSIGFGVIFICILYLLTIHIFLSQDNTLLN